jgi:rubrerythrin
MTFNADEALAMAQQIEHNGAAFYRRGAQVAADPDARKLLGELAVWEDGHEKLFRSMREGLSDEAKTQPLGDPNGEMELYLQAVADSHVFNVHKDVEALIADDSTPRAILDSALKFEKDSILFFMALDKLVPARMGEDRVAAIVKEEIRHVAYINEHIKRLANGSP